MNARRWSCWLFPRVLVGSACLGSPAAAEPPDVGVEERVGARLPLELELTSTAGEGVRLGDALGDGKPALLLFAYNRCKMLCSLVLRSASGFVKESRYPLGERFRVITIDLDPRESWHEAARTQATVLERAGYPGRREDWPFLLGSEPSIASVARAVGFRYRWDERTEQYAHPAVVIAVAGDGRVVRYFYDLKLDPRAVEAALAGGTNPASAGTAGSVLTCLRFDSMSRLYGGAVGNFFRAGGLVLVCGLAALITTLVTRARRSS